MPVQNYNSERLGYFFSENPRIHWEHEEIPSYYTNLTHKKSLVLRILKCKITIINKFKISRLKMPLNLKPTEFEME